MLHWLTLWLCAVTALSLAADDDVYDTEYWIERAERVQPWWPTSRRLQAQTDIIFVKTHKTASSTVSSILHRYCGEHNDISCFVPRGNGGVMTEPQNSELSLHAYNPEHVNVHAQHTYYWPNFLHKLVPRPAPIITIIRRPASRFLSTWDYRRFDWRGRRDVFRIIESMPEERSQLPAKFFKILKHDSSQYELCPAGPGWAISNSSEASCVQTLRDMLSGALSLVLITERLDEGLVLLSRMMGWPLHHVLYISMKISSHKQQHERPLATTIHKLERWLKLDLLLYQVAEVILDRRIQSQDSSFWRELRQFRKMRAETELACNLEANITSVDCKRLKQDNVEWVKKEHNRLRSFYVKNLQRKLGK